MDYAEDLVDENVIIIPHGSLVEYLGIEKFESLAVPTFGNRRVLAWESDREMEREWLLKAGVNVPMRFERAEDIDRPVIVKYHGAKGGRGFFIAKTKEELQSKMSTQEKYTIQEFILGTRYYIHFFYSPIKSEGYRLSKGSLEMLGIDRRVESNADEIFRIGSMNELAEAGIYPSFVVTGNLPLVLRESLLPRAFELGERVVETISGSLWGDAGSLQPGDHCHRRIRVQDLRDIGSHRRGHQSLYQRLALLRSHRTGSLQRQAHRPGDQISK